MPDRNIVGPKYNEETERGMFYDEDVLEPLLPGDRSMGHLLVRLGKFQSVGDAFRNGWNKPIPTGWNQYDIGKGANRLSLTIWNPSKTAEEWKAENPGPVELGVDASGVKWYELDNGDVVPEDMLHPSDELQLQDYPTFDVGC